MAHFLIGSFIFIQLSCRRCLHIFEINSLSGVSFIIFSHSEGCLFTLLIVSFVVQKLLSLIRSHMTHSSVLAWRIPGTREPGGLLSVAFHRVRHDWSDLAAAAAAAAAAGPICLFLLLFPIFWEVGHRGFCCDLCQRVFCLCSPLKVF